jgi:hypothetical protein
LCVGVIAASTLSSSAASAGGVSQPRVVSEDPADVTPNIVPDSVVSDPSVLALGHLAHTIYAGGSFHTVTDAGGTRSLTRHNIVAFDAATGAIRTFAPRVNGTVWAVQPYRKAIFVGGEFTTVNGGAHRAIVKVNATSGAVVHKFTKSFASGSVTELRMARGRLIVGGSIPGKLIALNPRTGKKTKYLKLAIEGTVASNAGPTDVYRFAVSPDQRRLVAIGNFTSVAGDDRWRAFMVNLRSDTANLNRWSYPPFQRMCSAGTVPSYLKDVDFSPDSSYFIVVASGFVPQSGGLGTDVCDAAARFETSVRNPAAPTWINYTGGDTLHSTVATGTVVYVQGHQRWLDNPFGENDAGPGAVSREGIGALNPTTGKALSWNPGKTRGVGGKDLLATSAGLWVASDGAYFNGEYRSRIAFCPL